MHSRNLAELKRDLLCRLVKYHERIGTFPHLQPSSKIDALMGSVVIDSFNAWAEFSRAFYFALLERPRTSKGIVVYIANKSIQTRRDASLAIIRKLRSYVLKRNPNGPWNRIEEPAWADPNTLLDGVLLLQASNVAEVSSALAKPAPFQDLRLVRNFYAHRNPETATRAVRVGAQYSILGKRHPTEILLSFAHGQSQALILDWLDQMRRAAVGCCT